MYKGIEKALHSFKVKPHSRQRWETLFIIGCARASGTCLWFWSSASVQFNRIVLCGLACNIWPGMHHTHYI